MIWSYLKVIGGCTAGAKVEVNVDIPDELIEHIKATYPDPPSDNRVIVINVPVKIFKQKMELLLQSFKSRDLAFREKYHQVDFKAARKAEDPILDQLKRDLLAVIPADFYQELGKVFKTEFFDYSPEIAFKVLRGERSGFSVFNSLTHFAKGKPKEGIADLPLWKIRLQKDEWNASQIKDFMDLIPNNVETNAIEWDAGESALLKYVISEVLRLAINTTFASTSFKSKFYLVCFRLDGMWPFEYPEFVEYYMQQIASITTGTCMICGNIDTSVEKLPTKQVGFFTDDQWSTQLKFAMDIPSACKQCVSDVKMGSNYVKKNLRFFIATRGKKKNPFEMYIMPYSTDKVLLRSVLDDISRIRESTRAPAMERAGIAGAVQRGRIGAMLEHDSSIAGSEASPGSQSVTDAFEVVPEDPAVAEDEASDGDKADYMDALMRPSMMEDAQVKCLSYMIVIFTHPEGNASYFHNVLDVILADGTSLKRLGAKIKDVTDRFNARPAMLKGLSHVISEYYYPKFLADLLRLAPVNREIFYRNAYMGTKQGFLQSIKSIGREGAAASARMAEGRWTGRNMFLLEMTNSLMEALDLWA